MLRNSEKLRQSGLNSVGIKHYNPNKELDEDYKRRDIQWANEGNLIDKIRKGTDAQSKLALAGSSTLISDVDRMNQRHKEMSMIDGLRKEFVREFDNYKADVFKKKNIYISPDVGVSLIDNPYLIDGANEEQKKNLDPSRVQIRLEQL